MIMPRLKGANNWQRKAEIRGVCGGVAAAISDHKYRRLLGA